VCVSIPAVQVPDAPQTLDAERCKVDPTHPYTYLPWISSLSVICWGKAELVTKMGTSRSGLDACE